MLTSALCFFWLSTRNRIQPLPEKKAAVEPENPDPLMRDNAGRNADALGDSKLSDTELSDRPTVPKNPAQAITLGSMDPNANYKLLVTLTTRGAGLEQAELISQPKPGKQQFRALEHDGGYPGYLGLQPALSGMKIRTVPRGSPAEKAKSSSAAGGLQIGDVIQEISGASVDSQLAYEAALKDTKPGEAVEFRVLRDTDGDSKPLAFSVELGTPPLDIIRTTERGTESIVGNRDLPSLRTTLGSIEATKIPRGKSALPALAPTLNADWAAQKIDVPGGDGVEFRLPLESYLSETGRPAKLEIVKRYRLLPASDDSDGYTLDLETVIVNENAQEVNLSFRQEGLNGLTLEGWWYSVKISPYMFSGAGQRDVIYKSQFDGHQLITTRQLHDIAKKAPDQPEKILFSENESPEARSLNYLGVDAQYFNASLLAHPSMPDALQNLRQAGATVVADANLVEKSKAQGTNVSFWFDTTEQTVPPQGELKRRYQIFIGPKDSTLLATHGLDRAIEYGWFPWIAKPLSAILHFFHGIVRNYGLAIVLLTLMVRGLMFPLGRKAAMNAQRMQELQPELKKINDLYKDNLEKRTKAMQDLYAKHNFKPLAGCLPMFIQLPIFIGLYRCLSVDISLRQEPLLPWSSWCSNLAGPDMLFEWSSWMPEFIAGRGTGWLGPYFNILPMATVGLFLLQQKMLMPKATDDQTRMTQNMMQVMTIFMGVLFFKVPSGLCIYFITSSIWSLIERKLVKKLMPATAKIATEPSATDEKTITGKNGPSASSKNSRKNRDRSAPEADKPTSRFQNLVDMLEKPGVKSATQRGSSKGSRAKAKNANKKRRP